MADRYDVASALQAVAAALLYSRSGEHVLMDEGANALLAEAKQMIGEHGAAFGMQDGQPLNARDLRFAVMEYMDTSGTANYTMADYELVHNAEKWVREITDGMLEEAFTEQRRDVESVRQRITDIEARNFVNDLQQELDLEKWQDGMAAQVGHDLEEVSDTVLEAIKGIRRGEDVEATLWEAHENLICIAADLMTMNPDEEEA